MGWCEELTAAIANNQTRKFTAVDLEGWPEKLPVAKQTEKMAATAQKGRDRFGTSSAAQAETTAAGRQKMALIQKPSAVSQILAGSRSAVQNLHSARPPELNNAASPLHSLSGKRPAKVVQ